MRRALAIAAVALAAAACGTTGTTSSSTTSSSTTSSSSSSSSSSGLPDSTTSLLEPAIVQKANKSITAQGGGDHVTSAQCIHAAGTSWTCYLKGSNGPADVTVIAVTVAADGQSFISTGQYDQVGRSHPAPQQRAVAAEAEHDKLRRLVTRPTSLDVDDWDDGHKLGGLVPGEDPLALVEGGW